MPKFRITMQVLQTRDIDAGDLQDAHNYVSNMMKNQELSGENAPKVLSIDEIPEAEVLTTDP